MANEFEGFIAGNQIELSGEAEDIIADLIARLFVEERQRMRVEIESLKKRIEALEKTERAR